MSLPKQEIADVPKETTEVAKQVFSKGNVYMQMRDELGTLYQDDVFADLYPNNGQPAIRPWRLALITVMQFGEKLSDRQAADAVRARIDWKYALSLELKDEGFHYSVLSEFRQRLLEHKAGNRLLDEMLKQFRDKGLVKARGQQRTDSTYVLAAVRELSRLENVGMTLRNALNSLAIEAPEWLLLQVPSDWFDRYGPRFEHYHLPKTKEKQQALFKQVGADGFYLLERVYSLEAPNQLADLAAIETLRCVWLQQFWNDRGSITPREVKDMPAVSAWLRSPFDIEARYCSKRSSGWVGYKVHITETCDEEDVHLITHIATTTATVQDSQMTGEIQDDLAQLKLLPATQIVDAGYVNSQHLIDSSAKHKIQLIGPAPIDTSWQAQTESGLDQTQFSIDWNTKLVTCPAGQTNRTWNPTHSNHDIPIIRVRFSPKTCQACDLKQNCTKGKSRTITLLEREHYQALQQARQFEQTAEFKDLYPNRSGIEGTISQAVRKGDIRRSRYIGLAKTHLQNVATAVAINIHRTFNWSQTIPLASTRISRFAALAS